MLLVHSLPVSSVGTLTSLTRQSSAPTGYGIVHVTFSGISTDGDLVEVLGAFEVEVVDATRAESNVFVGKSPGCFYYQPGDIRFHPGFTNGGNLFFYVADGDGGNVKYATIELQNAPNEP